MRKLPAFLVLTVTEGALAVMFRLSHHDPLIVISALTWLFLSYCLAQRW